MLALGIIFILTGFIFILNPSFIWLVSESWKSKDGTEPSDMYQWSTRFGGLILMIVGIGTVIVAFL